MRAERLRPRARLARGQKDILLRHLLRFPELFALAVPHLRPSHFGQANSTNGSDEEDEGGEGQDALSDQALRVVWSSALRTASRYCGMTQQSAFSGQESSQPSGGGNKGSWPEDPALVWSMVGAEVQAMAQAGEISPRVEQAVLGTPGGLLEYVFADDSALGLEFGRKLLEEYLQECVVYDPMRAVALGMGDAVPADLPALLDMLKRRASSVQTLYEPSGRRAGVGIHVSPSSSHSSSAEEEALGELLGLDLKPDRISSTGVEYLDLAMDGGDAPAQVYSFVGAYGAGKTTQAIQLVCAKAKVFQHQALAAGDDIAKARTCHLFSFEAPQNEIQSRLWSHAAQIHGDSISAAASGQGVQAFSRRGHLKAYEKELFRERIETYGLENVDGERERLLKCRPLLSNVILHDFAGGKNGAGFIDEIVQALRHEQKSGARPGLVAIDYIGLAARRHLLESGRKMEDMRHLIGGSPDACLSRIAVPMDCSVWIFHQLSADSNKRSFSARVSVADTAECRGLAENVHGSFALGTPHLPTRAVMFQVTKIRRSRTLDGQLMLWARPGLNTLARAHHLILDQVSGNPTAREDAEMLEVNQYLLSGQGDNESSPIGSADVDYDDDDTTDTPEGLPPEDPFPS